MALISPFAGAQAAPVAGLERNPSLHLLRDCLALGSPKSRRPPAKARLEEALGPELTQHLLESLESSERR